MQQTAPEKRSALFIINPHSGTGGKQHIPGLLQKYLNKELYHWDVVTTRFPGEATIICENARHDHDLIVAVGGDGTINEVARPLINTNTALGIIPCGSGNGLARHLRIPRNAKKAIQLLNKGCTHKIDTISLGQDVFLNVAGVGFDAHIAKLFAEAKNRGFFSYASIALQEIRKFQGIDYNLTIDGEQKIQRAPFLISIANSTQYGNNCHIAPNAYISDGLMDICVLKQFPFWYYPILIYHLFTSTIIHSRYYQHWQGKEVKIEFENDIQGQYIHLDGDPHNLDNVLTLSVNHRSLLVACDMPR